VRPCEHGNEPLGSMTVVEFDQLSDCWVLKDAAPWSYTHPEKAIFFINRYKSNAT
jgi:hypothetical protein